MDYPLLLLFIGQVVLVAALVRTGLPSQLWEATIDTWCRTSPSGTASCATALSNVISNVPFVLMVTPSLARPSGLAAAASVAAAAADALSEADSNDMNDVDEVVSLRWSYSVRTESQKLLIESKFPSQFNRSLEMHTLAGWLRRYDRLGERENEILYKNLDYCRPFKQSATPNHSEAISPTNFDSAISFRNADNELFFGEKNTCDV